MTKAQAKAMMRRLPPMEADEGKETQQKEKDLARLVELLTDKN